VFVGHEFASFGDEFWMVRSQIACFCRIVREIVEFYRRVAVLLHVVTHAFPITDTDGDSPALCVVLPVEEGVFLLPWLV
jgi:hypothetical protein